MLKSDLPDLDELLAQNQKPYEEIVDDESDRGAELPIIWELNEVYKLIEENELKEAINVIRASKGQTAVLNYQENELTPLHLAAEKGYKSVVEALLDAGADPKKENGEGQTPLDLINQMIESESKKLGKERLKKYEKIIELLEKAEKPAPGTFAQRLEQKQKAR